MRKNALRTLAALALLAVLSFPHDSASQCADPRSARIFYGGLADSVINPAIQEDNQFFTSNGGYPNIFFLIDTSGSMQRLPPNGPPSNLDGALPDTTFVGCDVDPMYGGTGTVPGFKAGTVLDRIKTRVYASPCGSTAQEGNPYAGDFSAAGGVDYAAIAAVCPYYTSSNSQTTGVPGYDQDFYADSTSLKSVGNAPNLFMKTGIYHDTLDGYANNSSDGWDDTAINPWKKSGNNIGTIADFCGAITNKNTVQNGGFTREQVCTSCLTNKGWFYDGTLRTWSPPYCEFCAAGTSVQVPSLWYTGNYLNFFPPKFVVARRVVKNTIVQNDKIRMAMAQFGGSGYQFVADFNPSCQSVFGNGNWAQNRGTYINATNALTFGGGTPLSMSLFDVGRYYHSPTLPWFGNSWENSGTGYESATSANQAAVCWSCQMSNVIVLTDGQPSLNEGSTGSATGNYVLPPGRASLANANSGVYAGDYATGMTSISSGDCPQCNYFTGANDWKNNLTRVAWYLHNYDLRNEAAGQCGGNGRTLDGMGMPGKQILDIYTIGFGTGVIPDAETILQKAADAGGGISVTAQTAADLQYAMTQVFQVINTRATSFSVATVSTLQTTTGHSVIVPRFVPSQKPNWLGHLYRYELYSEFVNNCTPNGAGDLDCDGKCTSVFLQDKDGSFIGEDGNGAFVKTTDGFPPCSQTPLCGRCSGNGNLGNSVATPWWDAYEALKNNQGSPYGWKTRYVWTVLDDQPPYGELTRADTMIQLDSTNAVADALIPYMALGTHGSVCDGIANKISSMGDPFTADVVRNQKRECVKAMVRWLLGADVFNEMGRGPNDSPAWPPPPANGSLPRSSTNLPNQDLLGDRKFKLGDIYHSSPVVVDSPLPSDGILCPNGLHNQCMESLWKTPVPHGTSASTVSAGVNAYDLYAKSTTYLNRRKVVIVGANDGLLHAFNGGAWHANVDDPVTTGIDESKPPFNGYYDRGEIDGAVELWAFLPPDLISKVPLLVGTNHQLMVDGSAMVRDVWVDGTNNGLAGGGSLDSIKQPAEFHTVAVVGERRGGTHYFALDLTNSYFLPTESGPHRPDFLWVYPQPDSAEAFRFGETYGEFLPVPPPIGPVRIQADANAQSYGSSAGSGLAGPVTAAPTMTIGGVATRYNELWVTFLPGGFDQSYLRGRGVHMVDVWTGKEVWDFSYPTNGVGTPAGLYNEDPRIYLQYPVAATPAMVMWGQAARRPSLGFENDGYFDTTTFGDSGGQLWVLRYNRPGQMDGSGQVQNWFGARILIDGQWTFTPQGGLCPTDGGHPFFYITANAALPGTHIYRVYAGTGDRFNLLDTNGGICGPDNVRACASKGCTVSEPVGTNYLTETTLGYDGQGLAQSPCPAGGGINCYFTRSTGSAAAPSCGMTYGQQITVSTCADATGVTGFNRDVAVRCTPDAAGNLACLANKSSNASAMGDWGGTVDQTPNLTRPQSVDWFFSIKVFEDTGYRTIFDTAADAANYDYWAMEFRGLVSSLNPFTQTIRQAFYAGQNNLKVIDGATGNPTTGLASATDSGWAIFYNHGPQVTYASHTYNVSQLDERTASVSGIYGKILWNTIQPELSEALSVANGCTQSKCTAAFRRLSYTYGADAITGGSVLTDSSGNIVRALVSNTLVPQQGYQPTVFVDQKGRIQVGGAVVNAETGASNIGLSSPMDPVVGVGATEVSRAVHACRHSDPNTPPSATACK